MKTPSLLAALLLAASAPAVRAQDARETLEDAGAAPEEGETPRRSTEGRASTEAGAPGAGGTGIGAGGIGAGGQDKAPKAPKPGLRQTSTGSVNTGAPPASSFPCRPHPPAASNATPRVADMLLAGQSASKSMVSRAALLHGSYLYISGEPGLQTIDVSRPDRLRLTSDWPKSSFKMNGAAAKGTTLYVTNWHPGEGLLVFDISAPATPKLVRAIATPNYSWDARITGDLLDVSLGNETKSSIVTYSIRDPRNPTVVGSIDFDERLIGNATRYGPYMYFGRGDGFWIYDVRDPAHPKPVKRVDLNGLVGRTELYRNVLYVFQGKVMPPQTGGIRTYSLEDPENPRELGFWPEDTPKGISFQGDLGVVPVQGVEVVTLNVSDPARLRETGRVAMAWPGTGHGGYPVSVDGAGEWAFAAATGGNNPACEDKACACYGGRVYSLKLR